ncbi:MAG: molybdopterin-dependent oxidoreductase [Alphaproteobacteria bacterium]
MRFAQLLLCLLALIAAGPAAAEVAQPTGSVVLTVSGRIDAPPGASARFDMAMLRALPAREFETSTIWTDGTHRFRGVSLAALLEAVGADGTLLRATALNDYSVEIPVADAVPEGPIVAYEFDGREMSVREKGPLWVVYPFDADADYRTESIYSRSIWQLDRLEVLP